MSEEKNINGELNQTYAVRTASDELKDAKRFCKDNKTTLAIQIREFIRRLSNQEDILF